MAQALYLDDGGFYFDNDDLNFDTKSESEISIDFYAESESSKRSRSYNSDNSDNDDLFDEIDKIHHKRSRFENKICSHIGCDKYAYYVKDEISKKQGLYFCMQHKEADMYNPKRKYCEAPECNKPAFYSEEGQKAKFCKIHKNQNMINVATRKCSIFGCNIYPSFNFEGKKGDGDTCKRHKLEGMIDVRNPRCSHVENGVKCEKFARFHKKTKCYTHKNL
jgi:hypothetical protein